MKPLWQDKLRQIEPYVPGEQADFDDLIKLNANENPYPPSPMVQQALRGFPAEKLRLYPNSSAAPLCDALAQLHQVKPSQVFVGNGSDDVLALAFQAFFCSETPVLFPDITYSFYPVWCDLFKVPYRTVPLNADLQIDLQTYDQPAGGILLPNPNAPTSIGEPPDTIRALLKMHQDCIVIIDEAYIDFGGQSCVRLLDEFDNLLITQTFSKSRSLAGLRIGAALGSDALIATLNAIKNSYNSYTLDSLAIAAGIASVQDHDYFNQTRDQIIATRERTIAELRAMDFFVCHSQANFLFASYPHIHASAIFHALREKHIYVRHFNLPRIDNFLRITIGTDEQMRTALAAIRQIIGKS